MMRQCTRCRRFRARLAKGVCIHCHSHANHPTSHPVGTLARLDVMRARVNLRLPAKHPLDVESMANPILTGGRSASSPRPAGSKATKRSGAGQSKAECPVCRKQRSERHFKRGMCDSCSRSMPRPMLAPSVEIHSREGVRHLPDKPTMAEIHEARLRHAGLFHGEGK